MKITHNKIGQNLNLSSEIQKSDKSKEKSAITSVSPNDTASNIKDISSGKLDAVKVDLSERAQDIRKAKELAMASPDVDMEKVEKFRKLIDDGKYKVDAKAVADRMVSESLLNLGSTTNE